MKPILYRVLSFDGGGIRGLYQSKLLEALLKQGLDVVSKADVLAGTSTGAIIATALSIGMMPDEISRLYKDLGQIVFPAPARGRLKLIKKEPNFSSDVLRQALTERFADRTLADCKTRLLIPALSLNQYKLHVFDSAETGSAGTTRLVDVVMASAAAPTYFLPAVVGDVYYVDGGLCCNNPAFRAVGKLCGDGAKVDLARIYVLSIGTGDVPVTRDGAESLHIRQVEWAEPALDLAMSGSSDITAQDCELLVGFHCRVEEVFGSQIALDDYQAAANVLPALAQGKAKDRKVLKEIRQWMNGPSRTGDDFTGTWRTTYTWEADKETDTLAIQQCGDFVQGETLTAGRWGYTLSGTVYGNALIGEWTGAKGLRGNYLLVMSREDGRVRGHWVGTGDAKPFLGDWKWERA